VKKNQETIDLNEGTGLHEGIGLNQRIGSNEPIYLNPSTGIFLEGKSEIPVLRSTREYGSLAFSTLVFFNLLVLIKLFILMNPLVLIKLFILMNPLLLNNLVVLIKT